MERKALDKSFQLKPKNPQAQYALLKEAADSGQKDAEAYLAFSQYLGLGVDKNEEVALQKLEELCKEDVPCAYVVVGKICVMDGRKAQAVKCFKKAGELDSAFLVDTNKPASKNVKIDKKQLYLYIGKWSAAVAVFLLVVVLICKGLGNKDDSLTASTENQLESSNQIAARTEGSEGIEEITETSNQTPASDTGLSQELTDLKDKISAKSKYYEKEIDENYVGHLEISQDSKTAIKVYATALANLYFGQLPVGIQEGDMAAEFTQYAIEDVDQDNILELILVDKCQDNLSMSETICGYDTVSGKLYVEWSGLPYAACYTDGALKCDSTVTQNMPEGFTPYQYYQLDQNNIFQYVGYVECWDVNISQTNSKGEDFPTEIDADGNGLIYVVYDPDYNVTYYDGEAFDAFEQEIFQGSKPVKLVYTDRDEV